MRPNTVECLLAMLLIARVEGAEGVEDASLQTYCSSEVAEKISRSTLKVLTLNISHGRNTSANQLLVGKQQTYSNLDAIARLLDESGADIAGVQEADAPSRWSGGFDHVRYLADNSTFQCLVHGLHSISWISTYGAALLSRTALSRPQSVRFPPSPPSKQKGYVSAEVLWQPGADQSLTVNIVSVHFDFLSKSTRDTQVGKMIDELGELGGPLLILGDLNSEWSDSDSHVRALAEGLGLHAYEPEADGLGTYKKTTGKRLDWILASEELVFLDYRVLPAIVADHFAVVAEFGYAEGLR